MTDEFRDLDPKNFCFDLFHSIGDRAMLLSVGDFSSGRFNTMTVSWGLMGVIWGAPAAEVVVRPQRYSREFLEETDSFTLSLLPEAVHDKIAFCGAHSGREGDKFASAGLTPMRSEQVDAPAVAEAEMVFECKIQYVDHFRPRSFHDRSVIRKWYPERDFHLRFLGRIVRIAERVR
ncbi:MAG: flavin reductase family protein [Victivallaceae bacterium]|nr:flavin reductase family protein [Victivallaceae bacterium]